MTSGGGMLACNSAVAAPHRTMRVPKLEVPADRADALVGSGGERLAGGRRPCKGEIKKRKVPGTKSPFGT